MSTVDNNYTYKVLNSEIPAGGLGRLLTLDEVERLRAAGVRITKPTRVVRAAMDAKWVGFLYQRASGKNYTNLGVRVSTT